MLLRYALLIRLLAPALIALSAAGCRATQPAAPATLSIEPVTYDASVFAALKWRSIGPNRGGRSIACSGSPSRPLEYYFCAVGGGLWKTADGGATWAPVTDGQVKSSSVGAVAVAESNPDVVYIGMGGSGVRGQKEKAIGVAAKPRRLKSEAVASDFRERGPRAGDVVVEIDPRYFRPTEVDELLGDASKARKVLGWEPRISFEEMISTMVKADLEEASRDQLCKDSGYRVLNYSNE